MFPNVSGESGKEVVVKMELQTKAKTKEISNRQKERRDAENTALATR